MIAEMEMRRDSLEPLQLAGPTKSLLVLLATRLCLLSDKIKMTFPAK